MSAGWRENADYASYPSGIFLERIIMRGLTKSISIILLTLAVSFSLGCNLANLTDDEPYNPGRPITPPGIVAPDHSLKLITRNLGYEISNNYDSSGSYLRYTSSLPTVVTRTNDDGTVSVAVFNDDKALDVIHVYEYSGDLELIGIVSLKKELPRAGAFTKDSDGNYYVFYAKEVAEGAFMEHNMALVKYSPEGGILNKFVMPAQTIDEDRTSGYSGVKVPYDAGSCRMEIAGNRIAVYFARLMFRSPDGLNHQASYGFIIDKNTFEWPAYAMPYASHSFNQFILPDGDDFVFVDHGDCYPRAFAFEKVGKTVSAHNRRIDSFTFKSSQNVHDNYTFAQMGGLVNTSDGYLFLGTYEKTNAATETLNDSRNMFLLKMNRNLSAISNPIWITDYNDKNARNAANPKIVEMDNGRYLIMWECMRNSTYDITYAKIIDKDGNILKGIMELPHARLNMNDVLRYNPVTGSVNWALNDYNSRTIALYSFNPETGK